MLRHVRFCPKCVSVKVASVSESFDIGSSVLSSCTNRHLQYQQTEHHHTALQTHIKAMLAVVGRAVLVMIGVNSFHLILVHID